MNLLIGTTASQIISFKKRQGRVKNSALFYAHRYVSINPRNAREMIPCTPMKQNG